MTPFIIRPHTFEATFSKSLTMNGVAVAQETTSVVFHVYWRWDDEPDMKPEYLGQGVPGNSLRVPFELKGRDVRLFLVSQTEDGQRSVANITEAEQVVFSAPARDFSGFSELETDENLAAMAMLNIFDDGGTPKVRNADATDGTRPCHCFAREPAVGGGLSVGETVRLFFVGNIVTTASRTPGATQYLSETPGEVTETPPTGTSKIVQVVGHAINDTEWIFNPEPPVTLV